MKKILLFLFCLSALVSAELKTWTNGGADYLYGTAGNWNPSGVPANTDTLDFGTSSTDSCNFEGARTCSKIRATNNYVFNSTLNLSITGAGNPTNPLSLTNATSFKAGTINYSPGSSSATLPDIRNLSVFILNNQTFSQKSTRLGHLSATSGMGLSPFAPNSDTLTFLGDSVITNGNFTYGGSGWNAIAKCTYNCNSTIFKINALVAGTNAEPGIYNHNMNSSQWIVNANYGYASDGSYIINPGTSQVTLTGTGTCVTGNEPTAFYDLIVSGGTRTFSDSVKCATGGDFSQTGGVSIFTNKTMRCQDFSLSGSATWTGTGSLIYVAGNVSIGNSATVTKGVSKYILSSGTSHTWSSGSGNQRFDTVSMLGSTVHSGTDTMRLYMAPATKFSGGSTALLSYDIEGTAGNLDSLSAVTLDLPNTGRDTLSYTYIDSVTLTGGDTLYLDSTCRVGTNTQPTQIKLVNYGSAPVYIPLDSSRRVYSDPTVYDTTVISDFNGTFGTEWKKGVFPAGDTAYDTTVNGIKRVKMLAVSSSLNHITYTYLNAGGMKDYSAVQHFIIELTLSKCPANYTGVVQLTISDTNFAHTASLSKTINSRLPVDRLSNGNIKLIFDRVKMNITAGMNFAKVKQFDVQLGSSGAGDTVSAIMKRLVLSRSNLAKGVISFSFDDAHHSAYDSTKILRDSSLAATWFVSGKYIDSNYSGNRMSLGNLTSLYGSGNDILSHTYNHINLTTLSVDSAYQEVSLNRAWLYNKGFKRDLTMLSYPNGAYDSVIVDARFKRLVKWGIATDGYFAPNHYDVFYHTPRLELTPSVTLAAAKAWIDTAVVRKLRGNIYTHILSTQADTTSTSWPKGRFDSLVVYALTKKTAGTLDIKPISQMLSSTVDTTLLDTIINNGGTISYTVSFSGIPTPTYQWRKNGIPINGATSTTYTTSLRYADSGASFDCVATNSNGTATSGSAIVGVRKFPIINSNDIKFGFGLFRFGF